MQSKLKEILETYINDYEKLEDEYSRIEIKCILFDGLLKLFDMDYQDYENKSFYISLQLNEIYKDSIYADEFSRLLVKINNKNYNTANEVRSFVTKIKRDYTIALKQKETLKNRLTRNKFNIISARKALLAINNKWPISDKSHTMGDLKKIIDYYTASGELSDRESLMCLNDLEYYNRNLATSKNKNKREEEYTKSMYEEIPNILYAGYEVIEEPEVDISRKQTLERLSKEIINVLKCTSKEEIPQILEKYETYNLANNEYNYVIIKVLKDYNIELFTYHQLLEEKDTYFIRGNRKEIIKSYYELLNKYLVVRNYYNKINEIVIDEEEPIFTEKEKEELKETKRLIYSTSLANPTKAKIIGDMDYIPREYYSRVYELIDNFINGTNAPGEIKPLSNNKRAKGVFELKDDQVRIVFKHIKDNIYNIIGAFAKKTNNDTTMYQTMFSRMIPDVSTEEKLAKQLEIGYLTNKQLKELLLTKGRKGTR